jgi:hypothetical protein
MRVTAQTRAARGLAALLGAGAVLAGCGDEDFANEPRPPVTVNLSGVINDDGVTVSPSKLGAGPVLITIANLTKSEHTVVLEGASLRATTKPVSPGDTGTIQRTLRPGTYEVRAGSEKAVARELPAATLRIGRERPNSNDRLLLP